MKKEYFSPEFDLTQFNFESILEEQDPRLIHSDPEVGAESGAEGPEA